MKAVIAIDSFKGSLSSLEAGQAAAAGIRRVWPDAETIVRPLADGGEGTVEALVEGLHGTLVPLRVTGPLGKPVSASYGLLEQEGIAVMEMAAAAGITMVPPARRNPLHTTTYGLGEMIRDAVGRGCRRFLIGIGGSATNDGGIGMLQALGFGFFDAAGKPSAPGAIGLKDLAVITADQAMPELAGCEFRIACDVTNPLCGETGASAVFGPQKGADPDMVRQMDSWMAKYAALSKTVAAGANPLTPGTGAAGGLGFAFLSYLHASLQSGISIVLEETRFEEIVRDADIVITGEGRLDQQTAMGKAPAGVAALAKKYGRPVIAFSGSVTREARICNEHGIDAFFPILRSAVTLQEAMNPQNAADNLTATAEQVFRLWALAKQQ